METILVVDDEPDVCELARDCLLAAGYMVLEATDGEEALRIAEAHTEPIHLLLTDVVMPRLNGVELAGRLTRQRPDTKVLYMSGFAVVGAQTEHLSGPGLQPGDPIFRGRPFGSRSRAGRHYSGSAVRKTCHRLAQLRWKLSLRPSGSSTLYSTSFGPRTRSQPSHTRPLPNLPHRLAGATFGRMPYQSLSWMRCEAWSMVGRDRSRRWRRLAMAAPS
jgi:CheY-like chemotaxis protein